jgi:hypothetical protein
MSNYISPGKRIFEAVFNELVYYVERECATKELTFGKTRYSWWEKLIYKKFPKKFSKELGIKFGLNYINNILTLSGEEYFFIKETYTRVKELYLWYTLEYPFITPPTVGEGPSIAYVTDDGTVTDELFTDGVLNRIHPSYLDHLNEFSVVEKSYHESLDRKLEELLKIRYVL